MLSDTFQTKYFLITKTVLIKSIFLHSLSDLSWNMSTWYLKQFNALCFNVIQNQFNFRFLQKVTWWPLLPAPTAPTLFRGSQALPQKRMQFLPHITQACLLPACAASTRETELLVHSGRRNLAKDPGSCG